MTTPHSTPFSRLSRIGLALGIGSTQGTRNNGSKGEDDSYIPYNGPYESPANAQQIRGYWDSGAQNAAFDTRSLSPLSFGEEKTHDTDGRTPSITNGRKYSDASRATLFNIVTEPRRRFSRIRQNSTPPSRTSYVSLGQGGGVGDTPVPAHRTSQSGSSPKRRDSVFRASVTDFRKSFSRSDDKHEKTRSFGPYTDDPTPSPISFPSVYEQASRSSRSNSAVVRQQHPYATASPYVGQTLPTRINPPNQKSEHVNPPKRVPAHLKPSSRASLLKASMSTPDLRAASCQPATYLKTKTHWLSAETWCDAFVFPRPRFLLRHLEEDSNAPKPRLISPAESIISEPTGASAGPKSLKKSQSVTELQTSTSPKVLLTHADRKNTAQSPSVSRPRSFALDDLALPSPIPSLITVLADRQNLQNERQMWQERATKSFGNKRTRSLSRSKSLGRTRKSSYRQPPAGTFGFLAERTLLGHQTIPSVVHTTMNSSVNPSRSIAGGGQATRSLGSTFPRLRSKSHGHSNSAGAILGGPGHRRKGSVSSILHRAKSTATGLCVGIDEISSRPDVSDVFIKREDTKVITLSDRVRGTTSPDNIVSIYPAVGQNRTSPDRGLLAPSRLDVSPTPSNRTRSAEGVGIAVSFPRPSEERANDEPITFPAHPYAQGANNYHRTPVDATPKLPETIHRRQPIIHPYAINSAHPATLSPQWTRRQTVSPARKMFAEIIPGHLREIRPEEIQYSPYVADAPRVFTTANVIDQPPAVERGPMDSQLHKDSEALRVGDSLSLSLVRHRPSTSTDSGIGASEDYHPYRAQPERSAWGWSNTFPSRQVHELLSAANDDRKEGTSHNQWLEPPPMLPRNNSNNSEPTSLRTASSGQINPLVFSGTPTPVRPHIESSGSSPGLSNDSSPPLTPRHLGRLDDLERFQDLFYNPTPDRPQLPELPPVAIPATESEHQRFPASPVSLTRGRSQLATLVRQLSEDLYELRNEEPIPEDDDRLEALNDEPSGGPVTSLGGPSSPEGPPPTLGAAQHFLSTLSPQHPLDQPASSSRQIFPEDVESEVSSLSDRIPEEDYDEITETLRLGNVEAVSTPPPIDNPRRLSGVALIDDTISPTARETSSSSLMLPSAGLTRSSYLTMDSGGSRISGLSAFPRPPSEQSADVLASYFAQAEEDDDMPELISATLHDPASAPSEDKGEWTHAL